MNPMQSELSCHVGMNGTLFCRICKVRGSESEDEDDGAQAENPTVHSDAGSESELSADQSSATNQRKIGSKTTKTPRRNKRKAKSQETMNDLVVRAREFLSVSISYFKILMLYL